MNRIVTFGCSNTYGLGLDKDNPHAPTMPNTLAWPGRVGEILNTPISNLSRNGSSNKEISNRILKSHFLKDDLVIILWSLSDRHIFYNDDNFYAPCPKERIHVNFKNNHTKYYYKYFHSNVDRLFTDIAFINLANNFLKLNNIKYINTFINRELIRFSKKHKLPLEQHFKQYFGDYYNLGLAYDNLHLSAKGHDKYAVALSNYLVSYNQNYL